MPDLFGRARPNKKEITRRGLLELGAVMGAGALVRNLEPFGVFYNESGETDGEHAVEEHLMHEEEHHHSTPLTDLTSLFGTNSLIVALMNSLQNGHFKGDDWSAILTNLTVFLGALTYEEGPDKTQKELFAIARDMIILTAIILGGAFGDKLLETKEELGLKAVIDLPDGYEITADDMRNILQGMSRLILETLPVNIASTGAAAIIFSKNLTAVADRLMFAAPVAEIEQGISTLESALDSIQNSSIPNNESFYQKAVSVEASVNEYLQLINEKRGKTLNPNDIANLMDWDGVYRKLDNLIGEIESNLNDEESGILSDLRESLVNLEQRLRNSTEIMLDTEKWQAIGEYTQSFRSVANLLGKFIGPFGDPPNAVLIIKMFFGEVNLTFQELVKIQSLGFLKVWDSLTEKLIASEENMMRAFGFYDYSPEATKNILGQIKAGVTNEIPAIVNKGIKAAEHLINGDHAEAVITATEIQDEKQKSLIRETIKNMELGGIGLLSEIRRMGANQSDELLGESWVGLPERKIVEKLFKVEVEMGNVDTWDDLKEKCIKNFHNSLDNNSHSHKRTPRSSVYIFLNALKESDQKDVEILLNEVNVKGNLSQDLAIVKMLVDFTSDKQISLEEQESLLHELPQMFGDLDLCTDFLRKLAVIREEGINIHEIIRGFDFTYSPSMKIQEFFPAIHGIFGTGTEEIASLVTLQFLSGPMVAHAFRAFVIQPVIDGQKEKYGSVEDVNEIVIATLLMAASSPLSDNGLVVNVGSTILNDLLTEGVITRDQFVQALTRLYNAAIEAGDGLKTGGPASAPFPDLSSNAAVNGWSLTWSNFAANIPLRDESVVADILKNIAYFRGIVGVQNILRDKLPIQELPESLVKNLTGLAGKIGGLGIAALDTINPSLISDLVAHKVRDTGDDFRNEVVNKGVLKLSKALGNIRSEIIEA